MSVTVATIEREALRLLSEPLTSTVGQVPDGIGGVTDTTSVAVVRAINLVQDWLCRRCIALRGEGTVAVPPVTTSAVGTGVALSSLTMTTSGYRMWRATDVWWNNLTLKWCDEDILRIRDGRYALRVEDAATHWWSRRHAADLHLYPAPRLARSARVAGLCLPPVVTSAGSPPAGQTNAPSFASDDLLMELLPSGVAIYLAKRLFEDPSVYGRLSHLVRQMNERTGSLWQKLRQDERERHFPTAPDIEGL